MGATTVDCGSSGKFEVFVTDTVPPVITVPANFASASNTPTFTVTATDNIDGAEPGTNISCDPASGSTFPNGVNIVQCGARDAHANFAFGSFTITVGTPVLHLPDPITAEATGPTGAAVTYTVTADGADTGPTCSPASGSTFPIATTTVTCTATNIVGTSTGTFTVTVQDTTPPTLNLTNLTREATGPNGATVNYTSLETATDLVDGPVTPVCSPASGTVFALGTTTVNCTATDAHGNSASGSFTIKVQDTTPPTITSVVANPKEIIWPPNHKLIPITIVVTDSDLVDPNPHVNIVSITSDQPDNCFCGDGDTSGDEVFTTDGNMNIQLRAERTGGIDRHYTITVAATDFSGNTATATVVVSVHP
jgi:hypothetical protein